MRRFDPNGHDHLIIMPDYVYDHTAFVSVYYHDSSNGNHIPKALLDMPQDALLGLLAHETAHWARRYSQKCRISSSDREKIFRIFDKINVAKSEADELCVDIIAARNGNLENVLSRYRYMLSAEYVSEPAFEIEKGDLPFHERHINSAIRLIKQYS